MAKRISKIMFDYNKLFDRVPENQKTNLTAFFKQAQLYENRVQEFTECPPTIDWECYKKKLPESVKTVEDFEQQYDCLYVPYPDYDETELHKELEQVQCDVETFNTESNKRIKLFNSRIKSIKDEIPFEQMTMEEYTELFPERSIRPLTHPTFWPHTPEENQKTESPTAH